MRTLLVAVGSQNSHTYHTGINDLQHGLGEAVELRLPFSTGVEVYALYRHYGCSGGPYTSNKTTTGDWEIPILAKYRLPGKLPRPFVAAVPVVDTLIGTSQTRSLILTEGRLVTNTRKDEHFDSVQSPPGFALHSNLNQVGFLLGITL